MFSHLRPVPEARDSAPSRESRLIRVVLADDHKLMRRSLRQLLDGAPDVQVVAEVEDQDGAIGLVRDLRPHVLVLDLRLPGGRSSVETITILRASVPATRVVVVTMESSPAFARHAFAVGAVGFVAKDLADVELVEAVRTAADGGRYAGPRVAHVLPRMLLAAASL